MAVSFYRFFPGDYARDTRHLSMVEHGAYRLMLDCYYTTGPLPGDPERVARMVSALTDMERAAVVVILAEFFTLADGQYRQARCDDELAHQARKGVSSRASARKRWNSKRNADAMQTQCEPNADAMREGMRNVCQNDAIQIQIQNQKKKARWFCPDGVEPGSWEDWLQVRGRKKAASTENAYKRVCAKLEAFRAAGQDVNAVVAKAAMSGWSDLYALPGSVVSTQQPTQTVYWYGPGLRDPILKKLDEETMAEYVAKKQQTENVATS